ncbi:gastrula zinc finger protein XlCGF26.1-like [Octopus sinensis]|uniref:Gastrula zinc finger protein XlCGF26.1-like n=1 Tax=Octopus sinensis TaxID=2607531 RepID=A0A6P7T3Z0_9MOLL|nr:gastrula zinc finger protein XlCGF26.1-like [Octopus sinensis]
MMDMHRNKKDCPIHTGDLYHHKTQEMRTADGASEKHLPSSRDVMGTSHVDVAQSCPSEMYKVAVPVRTILPNPKKSLLPSDKPFSCDVCGKKFARFNILQNHKKLHSVHNPTVGALQPSEKPFFYDISNNFGAPTHHHTHAPHTAHAPFVPSWDLVEMHKLAYERMQAANASTSETLSGSESKYPPLAELYPTLPSSTQSNSRGERSHDFLTFRDNMGTSHETVTSPNSAPIITPYPTDSPSNNHFNCVPSSVSEKSFVCDICKKCFARRDTLQCHRRIHDNEKPFGCEICGKKFSRRDKLQSHLRVHSGERPFPCNICGKAFAQSDKLKCHIRTHTGEKPHPCDLCPKRFARRDTLQCHRRTHTGEKPFMCDTCEKRFSRRDKLTCHRRVHTGEKPFGCEVCGKQFARSDKLHRHKRTHDPTKIKSFLSIPTSDGNNSSQTENLSPLNKTLYSQQALASVLPTAKDYSSMSTNIWQSLFI